VATHEPEYALEPLVHVRHAAWAAQMPLYLPQLFDELSSGLPHVRRQVSMSSSLIGVVLVRNQIDNVAEAASIETVEFGIPTFRTRDRVVFLVLNVQEPGYS